MRQMEEMGSADHGYGSGLWKLESSNNVGIPRSPRDDYYYYGSNQMRRRAPGSAAHRHHQHHISNRISSSSSGGGGRGASSGNKNKSSSSYQIQRKKPLSSSSSSWISDPEIKRQRRVVKYKAYAVEGKVKESIRNGLSWVKNKYCQIVHGC